MATAPARGRELACNIKSMPGGMEKLPTIVVVVFAVVDMLDHVEVCVVDILGHVEVSVVDTLGQEVSVVGTLRGSSVVVGDAGDVAVSVLWFRNLPQFFFRNVF